MQDSFTLYSDQSSPVHRWHPMTKMVIALTLLASTFLLPGYGSTYLLFLLALLPLAVIANVWRQMLTLSFKIVLPFAVSVFVIQGLFWTDGTPVLVLGPLSLKLEGLQFAVSSTGRILALVSTMIWLSLTTRPDSLMMALAERGVPGNVTYIVLATIQLVPSFQVRANKILDAQRARGLETEGNLWRRMRTLLPLVEPLVLGSIINVDERAISLEARAFSKVGPKTFFRTLSDSGMHRAFRWMLIVLIIIQRKARCIPLDVDRLDHRPAPDASDLLVGPTDSIIGRFHVQWIRKVS